MEFIRARIAEDRETARNERMQQDWADSQGFGPDPHDRLCEDDTVGPGLTTGCGCGDRWKLHDPAATLARCDALSLLLAYHHTSVGHCLTCPGCSHPAPCPSLLAVAAIWFWHPDYRQEWPA